MEAIGGGREVNMDSLIEVFPCTDRGQIYFRVEDATGCLYPFYIWRDGDLLAAHNRSTACVDERQYIDPEEWNDEYGGIIQYHELCELIEEAYQRA
jgi:hypothetical protein